MRGYSLRDLASDATAGVVVAAVALPLAIAFAIASLAPAAEGATRAPEVGLVTVVIAGAAAALLGGSRFLVTGPTGAFIVVLAKVVQEHGIDGLLLASFLAGLMLVVAGALRLGQVIKFIPYPVTTGFTAGIAVVIFLGQLPSLFGVHLATSHPEPLVKAFDVAQEVVHGAWSGLALALALATIAIIQLVKLFIPRVPGPVVALVAVTVFAVVAGPLWGLQVATVGDSFDIPDGIPAPHAPPGILSWTKIKAVLPSAFTIFLLGAIESLLAAVVADGMTRQHHDSNQELIGQGLANMASPLFGGIAATGAIARTATNVQNGAKTPLASLVHVGIVVAVLYLFSDLAGLIPMAALAGILVVVAWNMSEHHRFRQLLRMPREDAGVMLATFGLTVLVDLTVAVGIGLLAAFVVFLHRMSTMTHVEAMDPTASPAATPPRFQAADVPKDVLVYSIDGPFFFGAADQFQEAMSRVAEAPKVVVLRLRDVPYLDATGLHALEMAIEGLQKRGTRVMLSAIQSQPLDMMMRSGAVRLVGDDNLFKDTGAALVVARAHLGLPAQGSAAAPAT
ncbi:MAG: SulP family inorganic anion transporter [Candidatus Thermoplasmatota archaeon]